MCTATWRRVGDEGYEVYFNRDELKSRRPALPPSLHSLNGVPYLAPADGDTGGTWIGVNESGVTLCVLNLYGPRIAAPRDGATSRGLLLNAMLDVRRLSELARRVGQSPLRDFNPFLLLGFAPRAAPLGYRWDGQSISMRDLKPDDMPVTSSSRTPARVEKHRRQVFRRLLGDASEPSVEMLEAFHRGAGEKDRTLSVCLLRPDAQTVSHSHIQVDGQRVVFRYYRVVAEESLFCEPLTLDVPRQPDRIPPHIRSASQL